MTTSELRLVCDLRFALGDDGKRMQDELVQYAKDLKAAHDRMVEHLLMDAECPCCSQTRVCFDECTFKEDCQYEHEKMMAARTAIYGDGAA